MLSSKSRALREAYRTSPDSDMTSSQSEFDRLMKELVFSCKHVHAQPSFTFRWIQWVLTRMRFFFEKQNIETQEKKTEGTIYIQR